MQMQPSNDYPRFHDAGESGLLIEFGAGYDPKINAAVTAFDRRVQAAELSEILETMPSFRSLLVRFDPLTCDYEALKSTLRRLLSQPAKTSITGPKPRHFRLPVVYGGNFGPDIDEVAALSGIAAADIPDSHASEVLDVAMLGFSPGLAYLGQMAPAWDIPRAESLRPSVPVGAILVAVRQTVLPATPIPTGWRQIGQTPFRSLQPDAERPFLLSPGDKVSFVPITAAEFDKPWTFEVAS